MELLYELFLTISLSLIFTSFFIKLFSSMSLPPPPPTTITTDKNDHFFTEENLLHVDNFQWVPFKDEVVKVQPHDQDQGNNKSLVEFYDHHHHVVVENSEKCGEISLEEENEGKNDDDHEEKSQGEVKLVEIEIESVEEVDKVDEEECDHKGEKDDEELIHDWEEVGIKDYDELMTQ